MKKNIRYIFNGHVQSLVKGMESYRDAGRLKTMHDMRVDMKSIRSVFFLLEHAGTIAHAHKQHQRVKKIFATAGRIREWQLEARWLRQHRKMGLLRLLRYEVLIREANKDFQEQTRSHIRSLREVGKAGDAMLREIKEKQIRAYLAGLLQSVLDALDSALPILDWHDLRKWIKRLLHARRWIEAYKPVTPDVERFCSDMESLQASIGYWHDLQMLESRLHESADLVRLHANARHEALAAGKKLQLEKDQMEAKIRHSLSVMHSRWNRRPAVT